MGFWEFGCISVLILISHCLGVKIGIFRFWFLTDVFGDLVYFGSRAGVWGWYKTAFL